MPAAHSTSQRTIAICIAAIISAPFAIRLNAQATAVAPPAPAPTAKADSSLLTLDRIFASTDFKAKGVPSLRWTTDGKGYTALEPSTSPQGGHDLVRYDAESGR